MQGWWQRVFAVTFDFVFRGPTVVSDGISPSARRALTVAAAALACLVWALAASAVASAEIRLDPTYGSGGISTVEIGSGATGVAIAPAGSNLLLLARTTDAEGDSGGTLVRLDSGGSADRSFGDDGEVNLPLGEPAKPVGLALTGDGDIVVAADGEQHDVVLTRLKPSGAVDESFGAGGVASFDFVPGSQSGGATDIAVDSQGRIVVSGTGVQGGSPGSVGSDAVILRALPTGAPDEGFGDAGRAWFAGRIDEGATAIAVEADDSTCATGSQFEAGRIAAVWFCTDSDGDPVGSRSPRIEWRYSDVTVGPGGFAAVGTWLPHGSSGLTALSVSGYEDFRPFDPGEAEYMPSAGGSALVPYEDGLLAGGSSNSLESDTISPLLVRYGSESESAPLEVWRMDGTAGGVGDLALDPDARVLALLGLADDPPGVVTTARLDEAPGRLEIGRVSTPARIGALLHRGIRVEVTCTDDCRAALRVRLSWRAQHRFGLRHRVVGTDRSRLQVGTEQEMVLKLRRGARKKLRRARERGTARLGLRVRGRAIFAAGQPKASAP